MRNLVDPDDIARAVLKEYDSWPKKRRPQGRSNGVKEWTPLSSIVFQRGEHLACVATATGMKCLPKNKLNKACGVTIHDWHAEILAIRALNHFLLKECLALAGSSDYCSEYMRRRSPEEITASHPQLFALRDDICLHMYCSEAPCGDASMELTIAAQKDATPWAESIEPAPNILHGRSYFSNLGCIRRKPARPDAPSSMSKSCSDKLALKQFTSLLCSVTSLLISPQGFYLTTVVLPSAQFSESACIRAFHTSGRLASLFLQHDAPSWPGGYRFQAFSILTTTLEFKHSRRQLLKSDESLVSSNLASFSTPNACGTLIGGTLQGHKQFSLQGAAPICRRHLWQLALSLARIMDCAATEKLLSYPTYGEIKLGSLLDFRRSVKKDARSALGGDFGEDAWVRNIGDDEFMLSSD